MKTQSTTTDQKKQKHADQPSDLVVLQAQIAELEKKLSELEFALKQARESEQRSLADYQNVVRRTQEERSKLIKLAAKDVISSILLPLDHLNLAKEQLKDHGLNMVYQQFQQALQGQGVQEVEAIGQLYDEHKMEVIDKRPVTDPIKDQVVIGVTQRGYTLHGEVIRIAKVVIGVCEDKKTN